MEGKWKGVGEQQHSTEQHNKNNGKQTKRDGGANRRRMCMIERRKGNGERGREVKGREVIHDKMTKNVAKTRQTVSIHQA